VNPTEPHPFPANWRAEVLKAPPLIAPARQFVYPQNIPGEEDALARGALQVMVHPASGGSFLATFALGFKAPNLPTGIYPCPNPDELCALAGGYAYLIDTAQPTRSTLLNMRPVVEVLPVPAANLLVFAGHHHLAAWGREGLAWQTARLTWEGLRITGVDSARLSGFGWDLRTDRELPFTVDLATGAHTGGAFPILA
jgi:hypothetical protein